MSTDKIKLNEVVVSLDDKVLKQKKKKNLRYFNLNDEEKTYNDSARFQTTKPYIKKNKKKMFVVKNIKLKYIFFFRNLNKLDISVDKEILKNHETNAELINPENAKTKVARDRLALKKKIFIERAENTARAELLNTLETG